MVLRAAVTDVGNGGAVDGHAACRASEGEVAVVAENLVGMDLAGGGRAEGVCRNHGGVVDEMAEAALVDHVICQFIDFSAWEIVIPEEGELGGRVAVWEGAIPVRTRRRGSEEAVEETAVGTVDMRCGGRSGMDMRCRSRGGSSGWL